MAVLCLVTAAELVVNHFWPELVELCVLCVGKSSKATSYSCTTLCDCAICAELAVNHKVGINRASGPVCSIKNVLHSKVFTRV